MILAILFHSNDSNNIEPGNESQITARYSFIIIADIRITKKNEINNISPGRTVE